MKQTVQIDYEIVDPKPPFLEGEKPFVVVFEKECQDRGIVSEGGTKAIALRNAARNLKKLSEQMFKDAEKLDDLTKAQTSKPMNKTQKIVIDIVAEELSLKPEQISLDSSLSSLGADSLDVVEIFLYIEEKFNHDLYEDCFNERTTIKTICEYIEKQNNEKTTKNKNF